MVAGTLPYFQVSRTPTILAWRGLEGGGGGWGGVRGAGSVWEAGRHHAGRAGNPLRAICFASTCAGQVGRNEARAKRLKG